MEPDRPGDSGLARERTHLAWNRSGLAVVACIAVLLRRIWPLHGTDQVVALACISVGALAWAAALTVGRTVTRHVPSSSPHMSERRARVLTAGTVILALAGLLLGLLSPA